VVTLLTSGRIPNLPRNASLNTQETGEATKCFQGTQCEARPGGTAPKPKPPTRMVGFEYVGFGDIGGFVCVF
jgi:hypothetical protein